MYVCMYVCIGWLCIRIDVNLNLKWLVIPLKSPEEYGKEQSILTFCFYLSFFMREGGVA